MVRTHLAIAVVLLISLPSISRSQDILDTAATPSSEEEQLFEAISDAPDGELILDDYLEDLNSYSQFPLLLATATTRMLSRIPTLDPFQRRALLRNRALGPTAFVTSYGHLPSFVSLRSRLITDPNILDQAGFKTGAFQGSPQSYYDVLRAGWDKLALVILQSKGAGVAAFDDRLNGFLSLRAPIELGNFAISQFAVGDYRLGFGNGLAFGSAVNSVKTRQAVTGLDPHTSGLEGSTRSGSLRGGAATFSLNDLSGDRQIYNHTDLTLFYSKAPLDASIDSTGITSIATSSHRTATELARRNDAHLTTLGGHLSASPVLFDDVVTEIGVTAYRSKLDQPISNSASLSAGAQHEDVYAADFQWVGTSVAANGEIARSINDFGNATAEAASLTLRPEEKLNVAFQFRNIPEHYLSRTAAVFGERTTDGKPENGFYLGLDWKLMDGLFEASAYTDLSHPGGNSSGIVNPTTDHLIGLEFMLPHNALSIYGQFHVKSKDEVSANTVLPSGATQHGTRDQSNYLIEGTLKLLPMLSLRFQAQYVSVRHGAHDSSAQSGYLAYVGPHVEVSRGLSFDARAVLFHSSSYDARLYEYEPDVPGSSSFSPLYGDGWRAYVLAAASPAKEIKFSAKWSVTRFPIVRIISSGVTARVGNSETRISLQADLKF